MNDDELRQMLALMESYKNRTDGAEVSSLCSASRPGLMLSAQCFLSSSRNFLYPFSCFSFFLLVAGSVEGGKESKQERELVGGGR